MKFNRRIRALFSGSTRALFNGSVRMLSNPRARKLVEGNRHLLVLVGLCALALGLAAPLVGSGRNGYSDLGARTQTRTTTVAAAPPGTTSPPGSTATGGGSASSQGSIGTAASGSTALTSGASSGGTAVASSGGSAPSSGGAPQPSQSPAANFNATDHSSAQPARVHLTVGVSDNGSAMFSQQLFQRLHIKTARIMVAWNVAVMRNKSQLNLARTWIKWAVAQHVAPMVSFAGNGNYIPSYVVYAAAVKAFLHDFPQVKTYSPWNEPDWIYRPALANNPKLAADYFNVLIRWCHRCTIVAGDVYRPAWQGLASWVRTYSRYLHARPKAWALHPYDDVRAHTSSQIQALESVTSGPIWLTEISGVERRGHCGCPNLSPNRANVDERYLFSLPNRFHRIERIYHYQWQAVAAAPWDSGLLGPLGKPRPAYWTFGNAVKGKLP